MHITKEIARQESSGDFCRAFSVFGLAPCKIWRLPHEEDSLRHCPFVSAAPIYRMGEVFADICILFLFWNQYLHFLPYPYPFLRLILEGTIPVHSPQGNNPQ